MIIVERTIIQNILNILHVAFGVVMIQLTVNQARKNK